MVLENSARRKENGSKVVRFGLLKVLLLAATSCSTIRPNSSVNELAPSDRDGPLIYSDLTASVATSSEEMTSLSTRGFTVDPQIVFHPGQLACQFIRIPKPLPQLMTLEICHKDQSRALDNVAQKSLDDEWQEFKFRVDDKLEPFFEQHKIEWQDLGARFVHKNYEWSNKTERLPGWNFLHFSNNPIPGIALSFVEREPKDPNAPPLPLAERKALFSMRYHPNTVQVYLGAIIETADPKHRETVDRVSRAQVCGDYSYLADGTWIQWIKPHEELAKAFPGKRYPVRALVLGTPTLSKFSGISKPDAFIDWNGRKAAQLRLSNEVWDILAVELKSVKDMHPTTRLCMTSRKPMRGGGADSFRD